MKKIFAIAAAMLVTVSAFAQDGKSIYKKYSDAENVSAVRSDVQDDGQDSGDGSR